MQRAMIISLDFMVVIDKFSTVWNKTRYLRQVALIWFTEYFDHFPFFGLGQMNIHANEDREHD